MLNHNITDPQELKRFESAMRKYFGCTEFTKNEDDQYEKGELALMAVLWQVAKGEYTESIFIKGDTVYHPTLGKCLVRGTVGDLVTVTLANGEETYFLKEFLSFEPWPEPVHVRPEQSKPQVKDGWWYAKLARCQSKATRFFVQGREVYRGDNLNYLAGHIEDYEFIEFISE